MPIKRRVSKQRFSLAAELAGWQGFFEDGADVFSELPDIGLTEEEAPKFVKDAWRRLGRHFLHERAQYRGWHRAIPWAQEKFGEP